MEPAFACTSHATTQGVPAAGDEGVAVVDVTLIRTLHGAAAADDMAKDYFRRWPVGETRRADVRKPRAHRSLRRWWALCNLVHDNSDQFRSPEMVHAYLKIRAGHCVEIVSKSTGEIYLIPDSISYDRLDEDEFQRVWSRAVKVIAEDVLPGIEIPEIELEVQRICGMAA